MSDIKYEYAGLIGMLLHELNQLNLLSLAEDVKTELKVTDDNLMDLRRVLTTAQLLVKERQKHEILVDSMGLAASVAVIDGTVAVYAAHWGLVKKVFEAKFDLKDLPRRIAFEPMDIGEDGRARVVQVHWKDGRREDYHWDGSWYSVVIFSKGV